MRVLTQTMLQSAAFLLHSGFVQYVSFISMLQLKPTQTRHPHLICCRCEEAEQQAANEKSGECISAHIPEHAESAGPHR